MNTPQNPEEVHVIVIKPVLRADFPLAQPHFVLFVKREGKAAGTGALNEPS